MMNEKGSENPSGPHRERRLDELPPDEAAEAEREARRAMPRFFRWLDSVLRLVMVVILAALIITVASNVIGRFVLNQSIAASDELSRFLFIWVIFLGAALAHLHREHIAVDLLVRKLPDPLQRAVTVLQELLIGAVLVALLISAQNVMELTYGVSPLLRLPLNWVNASVPVCAAVMLIITVYRIAAVFGGRRGIKEV